MKINLSLDCSEYVHACILLTPSTDYIHLVSDVMEKSCCTKIKLGLRRETLFIIICELLALMCARAPTFAFWARVSCNTLREFNLNANLITLLHTLGDALMCICAAHAVGPFDGRKVYALGFMKQFQAATVHCYHDARESENIPPFMVRSFGIGLFFTFPAPE